jgi:hypothetical protein
LLADHFEHPVQKAKLKTTRMFNFEFVIVHCEAKA